MIYNDENFIVFTINKTYQNINHVLFNKNTTNWAFKRYITKLKY